MKRLGLSFSIAFALAVLLAAPAFGQLGVGAISGLITDSTGAVIPGAGITVVNTATNFTQTSVTNESGIFRVPGLQPGNYRVTIEAEGFKAYVRDDLTLRTGATLPLDVALEVGSVTEQIEVSGASPLLETETSAAGSVLEGELMYDLPNYQRFVASAFNFVPGVSTSGYAYGGGLGAYSVAGHRSSATGAFEDGVQANDQLQGTSYIRPVLNTVAEIKVITTATPAEYGHTASGVIDTVKKTGTNQFHGIASMYGRSRSMQHRLFFDKFRTSDPQPGWPNGTPSIFFLPDLNLSGPFIKNKTFFAFGWQHLIEKKTAQVTTSTPTAAMKAGDFSFGGIGNPIFDPTTTRRLPDGTWARDRVPNNMIPQSQFDPVARAILDIDPWVAENQANLTRGGPEGNLLYNENARVFFYDYSARVDHQFSDKTRMFWSVTGNRDKGLGRPPRQIRLLEFDARDGNITPSDHSNWSLGVNHVVNPSMIVDTRFGFNRRDQWRDVPSFDQDWPSRLGIPNVPGTLMPAFGTTGNNSDPSTLYGINPTGPFTRVSETLSWRMDVTKIYRSHSFKFGYEILKFRANYKEEQTPSGRFFFDGMTAGLQAGGQPVPNTGNTFAGFIFGQVRQAEFTANLASWLPRSDVQSFYFQDDWKFSPNLTLNLGLRYSVEGQFKTKYGQHSNFDPMAIDPVTGLQGSIIHPGERLAGRDTDNFQPRIGLAYKINDKVVFRSGFGINTIDVNFPQTLGNFQEYVAQAALQQAPGDPRPAFRISATPGLPQFDIRDNGTSPFVGLNRTARNVEWWDPNLRNAYAINFNGGLQYQFMKDYVLEALYQGSSGVGLHERWNLNAFPIDFGANDPALRQAAFNRSQDFRPWNHFGDIRHRSNYGHSTYHSGTLKLEKRYSAGLNFLTFYTWSKAINSQDTDNSGDGVNPLQNRGLEKALAGFHRAHRWVGTFVYELPFGPGKPWMSSAGPMRHVFGGWELAMVQTVESGNPYSIAYDGNPNNQWPTWVGTRRANLAINETPTLIDGYRKAMRESPDRFNRGQIAPAYNIDDFAYPAAFTPGNLGRNTVIGPSLIWTQVSAQKNFRFFERLDAQIRWDMQNPFKRYGFIVSGNPTLLYNATNAPQNFGKFIDDARTASVGGQPLMNLTIMLRF
jgi:hypothetical protein